MVYFDNAATGGFKPSASIDAAKTVMQFLSSMKNSVLHVRHSLHQLHLLMNNTSPNGRTLHGKDTPFPLTHPSTIQQTKNKCVPNQK